MRACSRRRGRAVPVSRTYCSQLSRAVGEQQFATASRGTLWLIIEHPGPWGLDPPYDTELPEPTKRYLVDILEALPSTRVLFIKRERKTAGRIAFFVAATSEREPKLYAFVLSSLNELCDIDVPSLVNGGRNHGSVAGSGLFLVCADGKRDDCCAKYGLATYKAMKKYLGSVVWQASHVGGDRFAANVVCFPHGIFYGRVEPHEAQPLADAYNRGHIYLTKYRGRSCYPFIVQAAEYFVRREAGITGCDALYLNRRVRLSEQAWQIEFGSPADERVHQVRLRGEMSPFKTCLGCKLMQSEQVPEYHLVSYRAVEARREG